MNNIWLHGTKNSFTQLQKNYSIESDYCNTGLGLFLTKNIELAKAYSDGGYIVEFDVDTSQCYTCNDKEFWSMSESLDVEKDLDPMGNYINLPGSKLKDSLLKNGYTSLVYNDDEMGKVLVLLDNKAAKVINCFKTISKKN